MGMAICGSIDLFIHVCIGIWVFRYETYLQKYRKRLVFLLLPSLIKSTVSAVVLPIFDLPILSAFSLTASFIMHLVVVYHLFWPWHSPPLRVTRYAVKNTCDDPIPLLTFQVDGYDYDATQEGVVVEALEDAAARRGLDLEFIKAETHPIPKVIEPHSSVILFETEHSLPFGVNGIRYVTEEEHSIRIAYTYWSLFACAVLFSLVSVLTTCIGQNYENEEVVLLQAIGVVGNTFVCLWMARIINATEVWTHLFSMLGLWLFPFSFPVLFVCTSISSGIGIFNAWAFVRYSHYGLLESKILAPVLTPLFRKVHVDGHKVTNGLLLPIRLIFDTNQQKEMVLEPGESYTVSGEMCGGYCVLY
jgi:hypothetical protein